MILENLNVRLEFDKQGSLIKLASRDGKVQIPIDEQRVTAPVIIALRNKAGEILEIAPPQAPQMSVAPEGGGQELLCDWKIKGAWGELAVRGKVVLPADSVVSEWTLEVENRTDRAIWQVAYPRVSGLTAFQGQTGPDWIAEPFLMGEKTPDPVTFVNHHEKNVGGWARSQFGCFDVEGGKADIAFSYPGMWTMQYLAYGHPDVGGIYFGAHDGQALYKRFGMYADGGDGKHAALALKQFPEDRTLGGGNFKSFYPGVVGVYRGDWWGASEIYRQWGLKQFWCAKGPTRRRRDIPEWTKKLDLWYWNWQFIYSGHPKAVVPIIKYLKEKYECEIAFHWYGCAGEGYGMWHIPEIYPYNPDCRRILIEGVKDLHKLGVHCIPYIDARIWLEDTQSFKDADGMKWVTLDEHGKSADEWGELGHTMCPTAPPFHDLIRRINNQMIDEIGMDGAYLDQVSGCYAVPCFSKDHDHSPGGHDHWTRGYRELLEKVQQDIKSRSPDNIITSESCIECYLDLFDDDLTREIANLGGFVGSLRSLPIPMFHSVYHEYHMTYGTTSTFKPTTSAQTFCWEGFRLSEALVLVSGCQLMISGIFAGDETKEKFRPQLEYMDMLTRARKAGREFFNLGVWKPPLAVKCDRVEVVYNAKSPPKQDVPAVLSGCFELDGRLCIVLVNHTDKERQAAFDLDPQAYGLSGQAFELERIHPGTAAPVARIGGKHATQKITLGPLSAEVYLVKPVA